jgi:hypothetical protein
LQKNTNSSGPSLPVFTRASGNGFRQDSDLAALLWWLSAEKYLPRFVDFWDEFAYLTEFLNSLLNIYNFLPVLCIL